MGRLKPRREYRGRHYVPHDGIEIYIPPGAHERRVLQQFYRRWYGYCPVERRNVSIQEVEGTPF